MKIIQGKYWLWTGYAFHKFVVRGGVLKDVQYKSVPQKDNEEDKHRVVPDGIKRIDSNAFYMDDLTTKITLPESLTTIDDNAFKWCLNLRNIHIPASVTHIGEDVFYDCLKVKITVDKKNSRYKVIGKCLVDVVDNKLVAIMSSYEPKIPEFITTLGEGFLCNCDILKTIIIPEGVKELPDRAFYMCKKLTEVILPSGLGTFGEDVFSGCNKDLIVKASANPAAIEYAKENGLKYEEI